MSIDGIVTEQAAKLDALLVETKDRLEVVEGPKCNRYHPTFNIMGHPYWSGYMFGLGGLGFLAAALWGETRND